MAGVKRKLTRPALIAAICIAIWAWGLLWMAFDFYVVRGVWTITPGPVFLMFAMAAAVPTLFFAGISLLNRRANGLPVFTEEVAPPPGGAPGADPLSDMLRNPPEGASSMQVGGRRVVVLADGGVIGEMLNGSGRRFASVDEFRSFAGL